MKLKTNKLLTLTLASSLVAITAGCGGGTKAAAPTGTTPVVVPDPVTYTEWAAGTTIATDDTANAFLAGVAAIAGTGGAADTPVTLTGVPTAATVETLNLAYEVTGRVDAVPGTSKGANPVTFGGAATNGVAFATNGATVDADLRYFAGVVAGADVGVPLVTATAAGTWNGIFQAVGANAVERDFELDVDFTNSQVSAIIPLTGDDASATDVMSYFFVGDFAAGVITGDIIFGDFSAAADADAALTAAGVALAAAVATGAVSPATDGVGTLSGLIGANGALGAFYSTANGADGYAGGFVATTAANVGGDDPDVVYADWAAGATQAAVITDNAFLAGTATGLTGAPSTGVTVETLNLAEVITEKVDTVQGAAGDSAANAGVAGTDGVRLGGAATNGVAFFTTGATTEARYFAGLHSTTDLGAPISAAPATATWNGLFQAVGTGDYATAAKAFALTVTYSATADSTIIGLVGANTNGDAFTGTSYYVSGTYDENGVITGNVLYSDLSAATARPAALTAAGLALTAALATDAASPATDGLGVLSGLIGANGAVGAFYSNAEDATDGYAGGFVVSTTPNATDAADALVAYVAPVVEYSDWTATVLSAVPTTTGNAFLGATSATALTNAPSGAVYTSVEDTDITGGVLLSTHVVAASTASFFAGLHSDTNLGAPVPTSGSSVVWTGPFQAVGVAPYLTESKTISLTVDFVNTTITGSVASGVAASTTIDASPAYHINGTYNTAGVISGFVAYSPDAANTAAGLLLAVSGGTTGPGTLTGLIGANGAVGAFISTAVGATGYAGGFAVKP